MNARNDGSIALITKRLMMENYLHPDAIHQAVGLQVEFTHRCNVPALVEAASKSTDGFRPMKNNVVKGRLADHGFGKMTAALLDESDPGGEVRSWFEKLSAMARA